jgi:hypothetical protein
MRCFVSFIGVFAVLEALLLCMSSATAFINNPSRISGSRFSYATKYYSKSKLGSGGDFFENFKKMWQGGDDNDKNNGGSESEDAAAGITLIASIPGT